MLVAHQIPQVTIVSPKAAVFYKRALALSERVCIKALSKQKQRPKAAIGAEGIGFIVLGNCINIMLIIL